MKMLLPLFLAFAAWAQTPTAGASFEVASVKPAAPSNLAPGMVGGPGTDRPGELAGA